MTEADPLPERRPLPRWIAVTRSAGRATAILGTIVSGGLMLGICADVFRREFTGRSIPGMIELIETFMVIVVFLGLAHAEAVGTHVRMSLVTNALPSRVRRVVKSFGMLVCAVGAGWFAWSTALRALESIESAEVKPGLLRFPVWPARIVIAVGFTVLIVEYLGRVWEEWHFEPESGDELVADVQGGL